MHKMQLYLGESQYLILRDWAARRKESIAQIVREMIDQAIAAPRGGRADPLDDVVGLGASGLSNVSANADTYLYGDPAAVRALEAEGTVRNRPSVSRKRKRR